MDVLILPVLRKRRTTPESVTPLDMCAQIIGSVENPGAITNLAGEGPGGGMLIFKVTVTVPFAGERLLVRAARVWAPEIRRLRAAGAWESAWTTR